MTDRRSEPGNSGDKRDEPALIFGDTPFTRRVERLPDEISKRLSLDGIDPRATEFLNRARNSRARLCALRDLWEEVDRLMQTFMTSSDAAVIHEQAEFVSGLLRFATRIGWCLERVANCNGLTLIDPEREWALESNVSELFYLLFFNPPQDPAADSPLLEQFRIKGEPYDVHRYFLARDAATAVADYFAFTCFAAKAEQAGGDLVRVNLLLAEQRENMLAFLSFALLIGVKI